MVGQVREREWNMKIVSFKAPLALLIVFVLFFWFSTVYGAEKEEKHPIDIWLEKCIEKDSSDQGMINCTLKAIKMWDEELNKTYQKLMGKLTPEERELLRDSQRQWLKFRDAEFKFIDKLYPDYMDALILGYGTMISVIKTGIKLDIIEERVKELQKYLFDLEAHGLGGKTKKRR